MADFVTVKDVTFGYGRRVILDDVTLRFGQGQVVAIMGGSGMGKTTLLKLIGGLETPDRGSILIDGEPLDTSDKDKLYAQRRRMGMLFQFGALFTDMSVLDNVAFPLREQTDRADCPDGAHEAQCRWFARCCGFNAKRDLGGHVAPSGFGARYCSRSGTDYV